MNTGNGRSGREENVMKRIVIPVLLLCVASAIGGGVFVQAQQKKAALTTDDYYDIQRLLYTNHHGYDFPTANCDTWTSTFLPDAVLDNGNTHLVGEKAIRAYCVDPAKSMPNRKFRHWTST